MAKRSTISKDIRRTICLKFLTEAGKIFNIRLSCASSKLAGAEGAMLVKSVMERILECDVFAVKLVKAVGAELTERRALLTADDFENNEKGAEIEAAPASAEAVARSGDTGGSHDFPAAMHMKAGAAYRLSGWIVPRHPLAAYGDRTGTRYVGVYGDLQAAGGLCAVREPSHRANAPPRVLPGQTAASR